MWSWLLILMVLSVSASLCAHATALQVNPGRAETPSHSAERSLVLLDEAHRISQTLPGEERAWLVFEAAEVAAPLDPKRGTAWALDAWELAKQVKPGQDRVASQKNALRVVAVNDPSLALRLYRRQQLPSTWDAAHNSSEDSRAFGYGNTAFKPVWERCGKACFARLNSLARYLGATGQYPYGAMSKIALDLSRDGDRTTERILRDAARYFQRDPGFMSTNQEFVKFILATRKKASPQVLRAELHAAIPALEQPPRTFTRQTWRITAVTPMGNASFDSQNEALLFQLLPIVKTAMPEQAPGLLERHASLRDAPAITEDTPVVLAAVVSLGGTANPARMQYRLDESRVMRVQNLAAVDAKEALAIAMQVNDPFLRAVALVSLAPAYSKVDANQADAWLSDASAQMASAGDDPGKKFRLTNEMARAQLAMGRDKEAEPLIQEVFDAGEAVFAQDMRDHPAQLGDSLAGYDELTQLTESVVKTGANQAATIFRIRKVKNDILRAALLISAARGMMESQN